MKAPTYATMSDREKYLFDLQGFIVIRGFLAQEEVAAINEAIDANYDKRGPHGDPNPEFAQTPMSCTASRDRSDTSEACLSGHRSGACLPTEG